MFISRYLSKPGKRYAIFENSYSRSDDRGIQTRRDQLFFHDIEVYAFLTPDNHDAERLSYTVHAASGYYLIGVLTSIKEDEPDIRDRQSVSEHLIEQLATRAEHILIGAYDGDAVLIWSQDSMEAQELGRPK